MPYNKNTALKNQKEFLQSQTHCGYPNIERLAKKNLAKLEDVERKQADFDRRIREFNQKFEAERQKRHKENEKK